MTDKYKPSTKLCSGFNAATANSLSLLMVVLLMWADGLLLTCSKGATKSKLSGYIVDLSTFEIQSLNFNGVSKMSSIEVLRSTYLASLCIMI